MSKHIRVQAADFHAVQLGTDSVTRTELTALAAAAHRRRVDGRRGRFEADAAGIRLPLDRRSAERGWPLAIDDDLCRGCG